MVVCFQKRIDIVSRSKEIKNRLKRREKVESNILRCGRCAKFKCLCRLYVKK